MDQETETRQFRVSFKDVNFEDPKQKRWAYELSKLVFNPLMEMGNGTVTGSLPKSGPGLVVMNHIDFEDVFIAHGLPLVTASRTLRLVARRSLVDLKVKDSQKAKERRGINDINNKDFDELNYFQKLRKRVGAFYMSQFDIIKADIGSKSISAARETIMETLSELRHDHLVGIFFQGTRRPPLDLLDDLDGTAALIARFLPKEDKIVPIYPVGISGTNGHPFRDVIVKIGRPFYHDEVPVIAGLSKVESARVYVRDRVGELIVDPKVRAAWDLSQRGLSRDEIERAYQRDPDLATLVELLDSTPPGSGTPSEIVEEIDKHARF